MIAIAGRITVDPARRDECVATSVPFQLATRREEPGCLTYDFLVDATTPDTVCVFELWEDAETLEAHFNHPNYVGMRQHLWSYGITGTDISKYRIDAKDPVYGPDRVASARFWSVEGPA